VVSRNKLPGQCKLLLQAIALQFYSILSKGKDPGGYYIISEFVENIFFLQVMQVGQLLGGNISLSLPQGKQGLHVLAIQ